jgi:pimeloyl-ACP methyl ester carboxylesterase
MAERLRHLVLVVPGVLGSVLSDVNGGVAWGAGLGDLARTMRWPSALSLAEHPGLVPSGLLPTIKLIPPFVVPGYDQLVRRIGAAFDRVQVDLACPGRNRNLSADVVLYPYDFRIGVPAAAEQLKAEIGIRLGGLPVAARRRRVIVVAHSLGGLVARYWLGPLGGWPDCRALITVATPHRGVPKALDWLLNGVRVKNVLLRSVTEVLQEWPSSYDLLPSYPAVLSQAQPTRMARALRPLELDAIAGSQLGPRVRRAAQTSDEITAAWAALGERSDTPDVIAVLSRRHPTPNRAVLVGGQLFVTRADPEWLPHCGWRGDGTVPASSAIPAEFDGTQGRLREVSDRHQAMASSSAIIDILRWYARSGETSPADGCPGLLVTEPPAPARLDLELDEIAPVGESASVVGSLPDGLTAAGAELRLTVRRQAARAPAFSRRSMLSGTRWQVTVPPLGPGLYSVTAHAICGAERRLTWRGVIGLVET